MCLTSGVHLDPDIWTPTSGPRHLDPQHLDPRYCTVYNTVEAGVQMSNFGNKVGHFWTSGPPFLHSTVLYTVIPGVQMSGVQMSGVQMSGSRCPIPVFDEGSHPN